MNIKKGIDVALQAIREIQSLDSRFLQEGVWVCLGSSVTRTDDEDSDIDLLLITDDKSSFLRQKTDKSKISACIVPEGMLLADSLMGKYGGYFAAKLFSPNIILENKDTRLTELAISAPALYFFPFMEYRLRVSPNKPKLVSYEQLTALALKSFFDCNPLFMGWWIKNAASKEKQKIWGYTVNQFKASIVGSGTAYDQNARVLLNQNFGESLVRFNNDEDYSIEAFMRGVNHWVFGIQAHDNDFQFTNWAYDKYIVNMSKYGRAKHKMINDLDQKINGEQ